MTKIAAAAPAATHPLNLRKTILIGFELVFISLTYFISQG
jgi:hypothetical protein